MIQRKGNCFIYSKKLEKSLIKWLEKQGYIIYKDSEEINIFKEVKNE